MKNFKSMAIALIFTFLASHATYADAPVDPNADLRNAVTRLLVNPELSTDVNEKVRISFFVTTDDQLVVLKTDARTKVLDEYIKNRLNYHKVNIDDLDVNRVYHLKVHFQLRN